MTHLTLTFLTGLLGGIILYRLRLPGGMMVGAILLVAALNICTSTAYMPSAAKIAAQSLAGAFIACSVERRDIQNIIRLWKPALILLSSMLGVNLLVGGIIWLISPLDLLTALLCAVPGGMSDTPIIAADLGADAGKVAVLQFIRMSVGIGVFPSLLVRITYGSRESSSAGSVPSQTRQSKDFDRKNFLWTLVTAFICGTAGKLSGVPAGTLVFSMFGVILLKFLLGNSYLPMWAKRLAQVLSGAYIGCSISKSDLLELRFLLLPAAVLLAVYFLNSVVCGLLLNKYCGFPLKAAMLTATPAGASDMALISSDLGVENKEVIELQIIRMVVVISVFPQIIVRLASPC